MQLGAAVLGTAAVTSLSVVTLLPTSKFPIKAMIPPSISHACQFITNNNDHHDCCIN